MQIKWFTEKEVMKLYKVVRIDGQILHSRAGSF